MASRHFKELKIWDLAKQIALGVYKVTSRFPKSELYGLSTQMRRSAVSISSNIAEGFYRKHNNEYRHFLYIALGSLGELESQLEISSGLMMISKEEKLRLLGMLNSETRMIRSLIKCLSADGRAKSQ